MTVEPPPDDPALPRFAGWRRWLPLALLVLVSITVVVSGIAQFVDFDRLLESRQWLREAVDENRPRAIALAVLCYTGAVIVSVPATLILTIFCGFLFGTVIGALVAIASATTGASIVFLIGQNAARDLILRKAGPRLGRVAESFRRDAFGYIAFLRLLPIFPFWMTNLLPAALGVSLRTFALATLLGLTPGAFVYAGTGAGIDDLIAAQEAARSECLAAGGTDCRVSLELRNLVTPTLLAALGALALLSVFSITLRRWFERRESKPAA